VPVDSQLVRRACAARLILISVKDIF